MITCSECGNELRPTAKFCTHCGAKVNPTANDSSEKMETKEEGEGTPVEEEVESNPLAGFEHYVFEYIDFAKQSLISPSTMFSAESELWIFGLVNLILYSTVLATNNYAPFFEMFLKFFIMQGALTGVLFLINQWILKGKDTFYDTLGKYGALLSGQIILFLLLNFFDQNSGFGALLLLLSTINQLLIINLYIFNNQSPETGKIDHYYQLILSYIPIIIVMAFMANSIL